METSSKIRSAVEEYEQLTGTPLSSETKLELQALEMEMVHETRNFAERIWDGDIQEILKMAVARYIASDMFTGKNLTELDKINRFDDLFALVEFVGTLRNMHVREGAAVHDHLEAWRTRLKKSA